MERKEGMSVLEASATETPTRCVSAGARIPGQGCVEDKGSLAAASCGTEQELGVETERSSRRQTCFFLRLQGSHPASCYFSYWPLEGEVQEIVS